LAAKHIEKVIKYKPAFVTVYSPAPFHVIPVVTVGVFQYVVNKVSTPVGMD